MAMEKAEELVQAVSGENGGDSIGAVLKSKEVLVPALVGLVGSVAAAKGPGLLRGLGSSVAAQGENEAERLGKKAVEGAKGNADGIGGKALQKAFGGQGGQKKTRRLPIQRWTDVAVPVEQAYEAWTDFDEYPKFMHRVLHVEETDRNRVEWQEKIWFSTRKWEGEITDRRKNDRIAWKTTNGMSHRGVVTFHKLDSKLTRVMIDMEFEPQGVIEKMASGLRFVKRAVESDLARFKAHVEMDDAKGIDYREATDDESGQEQKGNDDGDAEHKREQRRRDRRQRQTA